MPEMDGYQATAKLLPTRVFYQHCYHAHAGARDD